MSADTGSRSLTVRISPNVYESSRIIARKRQISLNALIQQSLEALIWAEEEQASDDAYTLLGQNAEECDVEYAIYAQAEVMLGND